MARSSAGVRVFSDDGNCVTDARLMRRALEYVPASTGSSLSMPRIRNLPARAPAATKARYPGSSDFPDGPRLPRQAWLRETSDR